MGEERGGSEVVEQPDDVGEVDADRYTHPPVAITTSMDTRTWRRWVLGLSAITILVAVFLLLQWNVRYPRPEMLGTVAVLGLGLAIISSIFVLTTDLDY